MTLKGSTVAKQWVSEINDKLNSSLTGTNLLTFHTLLLLHEIKSNDKLSLMKTYLTLCQGGLKSQFASCQLVRYIVDLLRRGDVEDSKTQSVIIKIIPRLISAS
jgi:coatomer protein complex subunit gamma